MVYKSIIIFLFLIVMFTSGCWYYSFKGSLPSEIQTVAIVSFDDRSNSAYPTLREDLTNKVTDAFIEDNTLKIVNENEADLIISGTITSVSQRASTVTAGEIPEEYQLTVAVKVKCEDVSNSKVLWERSISQYGIMSSQALDQEREDALQEAIDKIKEEILNNTLGYW